jgi:hypothetical protein
MKDRVVGKGNEQGNNEKKRGKRRGSNAIFWFVLMLYDESLFRGRESSLIYTQPPPSLLRCMRESIVWRHCRCYSGTLEVDSKGMAADINAIMEDTGWLFWRLLDCPAKSRIFPGWRMR